MSTSLLQLPPLSLYIHTPWCVRKCPYCDFNSHALKSQLPAVEYVNALLADLDQDLGHVQGRSLHSIFIGGGTPSLLPATAYEQLFSGIRQRLTLSDDIEITMEANPGTMDEARFTAFRRAGINRLSVGVQSFNPQFLQTLGRIHDGRDALRAVTTARQSGFTNLNLDLMFGLPGQSIEQCLEDLDTAISLKPEHISWYQLTLEPNTVFHRYPPSLPVEDEIAAMQEAGQTLLASHGYQQYETSAYARNTHRCNHNLNYWQFGDYLGIGAGAHGKLTHPEEGRILRTRKTRQPEHYLSAIHYCVDSSAVEAADMPLEFMMNAMRLNEGFTTGLFEIRTGIAWHVVSGKVDALGQQGLVDIAADRISPTARGRLFLNDILLAFTAEV